MNEQISTAEFNKEIPEGNLTPLPMLPEREWLEAIIVEVNYQYAEFKNEIQFVKDEIGNIKLDEDGNPIKRREFEITFELPKFSLDNGEPRKQWLRLSSSRFKKAYLPGFLKNVGIDSDGVTPQKIIDELKNKKVKLQLATKTKLDGSGQYQIVLHDTVRQL